MLLESWRSFEDEFGTVSDKERVDKLMPEKVKKRRKVQADDGVRTETLELVISCQMSTFYLLSAVCTIWASEQAAWLPWKQSRVYRPPRGGDGRQLAKVDSRKLYKVWYYFWSIKQEVRIERNETPLLGKTQSRDFVSYREALIHKMTWPDGWLQPAYSKGLRSEEDLSGSCCSRANDGGSWN